MMIRAKRRNEGAIKALETGIERHHIEGVEIAVYSPAKTVADCFKYRNKIGIDVAIEALKDTLTHKKASIPEIWKYAEICRVSKVISPYLEALQSQKGRAAQGWEEPLDTEWLDATLTDEDWVGE